jgi:hypothetical protein
VLSYAFWLTGIVLTAGLVAIPAVHVCVAMIRLHRWERRRAAQRLTPGGRMGNG